MKVEPDIDYYQNLVAHTLLEVIPNAITHGLTDPKKVYVLRWIAGNARRRPRIHSSLHDRCVVRNTETLNVGKRFWNAPVSLDFLRSEEPDAIRQCFYRVLEKLVEIPSVFLTLSGILRDIGSIQLRIEPSDDFH